MAGAPSQLELFDHKPDLIKLDGKECPPSLLEGKRFAFIRGIPKMLGPQAKFKQVDELSVQIGGNKKKRRKTKRKANKRRKTKKHR